MLNAHCQAALANLRQHSLERQLPPHRNGHSSVDFSSNDYLQLGQHPEVLAEGMACAQQYGAGATGSRLLSGNLPCFVALEEELAAFKNSQAALFLSSGYQANATVLAALLDPALWQGQTPCVFSDRLNHASLHHACQLRGIRQQRFAHNNMQHLAELLCKTPSTNTSPKIIVTESVFGMEGDALDVVALAELALQHNAMVYLDEAHATGILGPEGRGLGATQHPAIAALKAMGQWVVMGTCSKALGVCGAYIACSEAVKHYLVNRCTGFVYSTAPSPFVVGAVRAALRLVPRLGAKRTALLGLAATLRQHAQGLGLNTGTSSTHIVPLVVGSATHSLHLQAHLVHAGLRVFAVRPPTVPPKSARVRLALHAGHLEGPGFAQLQNALKQWAPQ